MSAPSLREVAEAAGLVVDWIDASDQKQRVSDASLERILAALGYHSESAPERRRALEQIQMEAAATTEFITADEGKAFELPFHIEERVLGQVELESGRTFDVSVENGMAPAIGEPGYHRCTIGGRQLVVAIAPRRAFGLDDIAPGERLWGGAAQIYALRGKADFGFGDLGDVADAAVQLAQYGADALAISPCHALFAAAPERYGPYGPSSRLAFNPLYANPRAALGPLAEREAPFVANNADLIDWGRAGVEKLAWLRRLYATFECAASDTPHVSFHRFVRDCGDPLQLHARFEALQAHFMKLDGAFNWREWPAPYRDAQSREVSEFAQANAEEVRFHLFLQWLAAESFAAAQRAAAHAEMRIGLIADIAVGVDPAGSQAWSRPEEMLHGLSVGAPPDALGPMGQNWGVTTFSPPGLKRARFAGFIETLRANLRHAGGARIDHILGLRRLWVVPEGVRSREGAYLRYPEQDLLRLIKLESHRARAIIIGEDLGTVPPGFTDLLARSGILGMRVLYFEREANGRFRTPAAWLEAVAAMTTTHDLPPVAGWWRGGDIDWRARLEHLPAPEAQARSERSADRTMLWRAFEEVGLTSGQPSDNPDAATDAALAFVAATPSTLMLAPMEDLLGIDEQANLPGTTDEHPNWRRRLPEDAFEQPHFKARVERLGALRGRR